VDNSVVVRATFVRLRGALLQFVNTDVSEIKLIFKNKKAKKKKIIFTLSLEFVSFMQHSFAYNYVARNIKFTIFEYKFYFGNIRVDEL
jgi:hypothetical protein